MTDSYKTCIADEIIQQHYPEAVGTAHVLTTDLSVVAYAPLLCYSKASITYR